MNGIDYLSLFGVFLASLMSEQAFRRGGGQGFSERFTPTTSRFPRTPLFGGLPPFSVALRLENDASLLSLLWTELLNSVRVCVCV